MNNTESLKIVEDVANIVQQFTTEIFTQPKGALGLKLGANNF